MGHCQGLAEAILPAHVDLSTTAVSAKYNT